MKRLAILVFLFASPVFAADWPVKQVIKTYAISGTDPASLYASIGENGPVIGQGQRAIATTVWDLKWRRDYRAQGSACVLKSAQPLLSVITTLPKPAARLSGDVARRWQQFIAGITAHEKVHGDDIVAMTEQIVAETVGLRVENDSGCKAIRAAVLKRVQAAADAYKAKSSAFDAVEMRDGGTVQRLILALVNG